MYQEQNMALVNDSSVSNDCITAGDYIVVQRQQFFKLHQLSDKVIALGKDKVDLKPIIGKPFWSLFKMVLKKGSKREYNLEICSKAESLSTVVMKNISSGSDNRNITDDGKSQKLSTEEIVELRDSGLSPKNIVSKLIENSKTFTSKTEYSQEKYLKKKEKKYAEYIIIRKPTLRLLSEIFYRRDQAKVFGLRYDTVSQIITAANIQSNGTYLLFETGTQALLGAAILNYLGEQGVMINISLGNQPQKQAILGMNYSAEKIKSCLCVKLRTFLSTLNPDWVDKKKEENISSSVQVDDAPSAKEINGKSNEDCTTLLGKRKISDDEELPIKKPRWAEEVERACTILKAKKADGLVIASREFPLSLIEKLIPYMNPSRPLIIYSLYREPLVELYGNLKKRKDVVGLHLTETWLRTYQVLPDRTHPDVLMSASGGHLLYGTVVANNGFHSQL